MCFLEISFLSRSIRKKKDPGEVLCSEFRGDIFDMCHRIFTLCGLLYNFRTAALQTVNCLKYISSIKFLGNQFQIQKFTENKSTGRQ